MPLWLQIIIVASTFAGLLFAAFAMWLGFKEKQAQIGTSVSELRDTVAAQQKALEAAERRFQNLEAIVTSQVWEAVHDEALPEAKKRRALSQQAPVDLGVPEEDVPEEDVPEDKSSDAERVARVARRLKT